MKNTRKHGGHGLHTGLGPLMSLVLLACLPLGCTRSGSCQDTDTVCADQLTVATTLSAHGPDSVMLTVNVTTPSGKPAGEGLYKFKFRLDGVTRSMADVADLKSASFRAGLYCPTRYASWLYDVDPALGTSQRVDVCVDEGCHQQSCADWVKARRATPVVIDSEALAQKYGATVHCQKLELNLDRTFPEFTWRALSSQSLTFPAEPRVISTVFGFFKQVKTTKGSDMNDQYTPHIANGKEMVADTSYGMVLPIRMALSELIPGSGTDYTVLRAGFTFGGTTLGCNIEQKKLHAILTQTLGDGLSLSKGKTLHVKFSEKSWGSTAGQTGWCFKITDVGAQPMFKQFDENTDGTECLTE